MNKKQLQTVLNTFTSLYIVFMFSVLPLIFHDYYFDIQDTKFQWFLYASFAYLGLCTCFMIGYYAFHIQEISINKIWKSMSKIDIGMLAFLLYAYIATKNSVDVGASWDNESGRHMGLLFYSTIVFVYFYISRCFTFNKVLLTSYLITCGCVSLLAVLNFFDIDPFGFYLNLSNYQGSFYLSTLGNTNYIGSFICLSLPLSFIGYCYATTKRKRLLFGCSLVSGTFLLLCANADSGYLGVLAFLAVFLFIILKDYTGIRNYVKGLMIMMVTARILGWLSIIFTQNCRPFFTLSYYVTRHEIGIWILFILGVIMYILYVCEDEHKRFNIQKTRKLMLCGMLGILCVGIGCFLYMTFIHKEQTTNTILSYFQFNDAWGTGRGFAWRKCWEAYLQLPLMGKIFGYGLDTTSILLYNTFFDETLWMWDAAHNEYLQYLITGGIAMVISYLFIIIQSLKIAWNKTEDKYVVGIGCVIFAYCVQAFVNIAQPVTTPLLFLFIAILASQQHKKAEDLK